MRPPLSPPTFCDIPLSDGYAVRARFWPGRNPVRATVLYLHGIQSHGGWYEWSASILADTGAAVLLPDRRGSGLNAVNRGDAPSHRRLLADLDDLASWLRAKCPGQPLDVVGVSWGAKLAVAWSAAAPEPHIRRLLLIAPGIVPRVDVRTSEKLRIAAAALFAPRKFFDLPLNDPRLFTGDPDGRDFIAKDPLKLERVTARLFTASALLDRSLRRANPNRRHVPTSVILAEKDRIIDNFGVREWLERLPASCREIIEFPAAHHTLEFEPSDGAGNLFERRVRDWCADPDDIFRT